MIRIESSLLRVQATWLGWVLPRRDGGDLFQVLDVL